VKATMTALENLRSPDEVAKLRGLTVSEVLGTGDGNGAAAGGDAPAETTTGGDAPAETAAPAEPAPEASSA
jgi:small subunit ribosomal protein S5